MFASALAGQVMHQGPSVYDEIALSPQHGPRTERQSPQLVDAGYLTTVGTVAALPPPLVDATVATGVSPPPIMEVEDAGSITTVLPGIIFT